MFEHRNIRKDQKNSYKIKINIKITRKDLFYNISKNLMNKKDMRLFFNKLNLQYYKNFTSASKVMELNGFKILCQMNYRTGKAIFTKNGEKQSIHCVNVSDRKLSKINVLN